MARPVPGDNQDEFGEPGSTQVESNTAIAARMADLARPKPGPAAEFDPDNAPTREFKDTRPPPEPPAPRITQSRLDPKSLFEQSQQFELPTALERPSPRNPPLPPLATGGGESVAPPTSVRPQALAPMSPPRAKSSTAIVPVRAQLPPRGPQSKPKSNAKLLLVAVGILGVLVGGMAFVVLTGAGRAPAPAPPPREAPTRPAVVPLEAPEPEPLAEPEPPAAVEPVAAPAAAAPTKVKASTKKKKKPVVRKRARR